MNVTMKTVIAELVSLNLALNGRRSQDQLEILAEIWFTDCQHMQHTRFVQAVAACRRTSKWFPTPADINEQHDFIVSNIPETNTLQLEDAPPLTLAEETKRLERLRKLVVPEKEATIYINEKYKPKKPLSKNVVYVRDEAHKCRIKSGLE